MQCFPEYFGSVCKWKENKIKNILSENKKMKLFLEEQGHAG